MKLKVIDMASNPGDCLFSAKHVNPVDIPYNEEPLESYVDTYFYTCKLSKGYRECNNTDECPYLEETNVYPLPPIRSSFRGDYND